MNDSSSLQVRSGKKKSVLQAVWDFVGIPFRLVLFDQSWLPRWRWTTLEDERLNRVMPYIHGDLLDIGAGPNTLVKRYGQGTGVHVVESGGGAVVVQNTAELPFADASFDTVTFIACLNHIPYRDKALTEARRLLRPGGRLLITMIDPILGEIGHKIWWYGEDKHRHVEEGETGGMWTKDIVRLAEQAGFVLRLHQRFVYGMNHFYLFEIRQ